MAKPGPIVISLEGTTLTKQEQQILSHKNIGGLILFSKNFKNKQQITELVTAIRSVNQNIVIMVDHEGGTVWRFKDQEFFNPGPMQEPGTLYNTDPNKALTTAFQRGQQIATDLLNCGIDLNLAPVLDLDYDGISSVIGNRSIHSNPKIVALIAEQFIIGQQSVGMGSVGKHFPGHGAIAEDTHNEIAVDSRDFQLINNQDLEPFKLLHHKLSAIMPAHVIYEKVDPNPAGFSKVWLQNILRNQLSFKGAIISDCLSMKAAQQFINKQPEQQNNNVILTKQALDAGCDLVIFNGLHRSDLLNLLDHLNWNMTEEQAGRINNLKSFRNESKRVKKYSEPKQSNLTT